MTGRSLHDALLRVLTSSTLRAKVQAGDRAELGAVFGPAEAATLCEADQDRVARLARFFTRHFYRERIVRLFVASRRLAREAGWDPLSVLGMPGFEVVLNEAEVGSSRTADAVATLVESRLRDVLGARPWGRSLVEYEGILFRTEAGPRLWRDRGLGGDVPARATSARIVGIEWDVIGLVAAARRGDERLPDPPQTPTRLLVALSPDGRVTTARCPEVIERVWGALDGVRAPADVARQAGLGDAEGTALLRQLTEVGAVEWRRGRG